MKKIIILLVGVALLFILCACDDHEILTDEEERLIDRSHNYRVSVCEMCTTLNSYIEDRDIDGVRSLLVSDLKDTVNNESLERLANILNDELIVINPQDKESEIGLKRGYIEGKAVIYSDIEFYNVEGDSGRCYHIWIQMCNYIEDEANDEGINFIRISDTTEDTYDVKELIGYYYSDNTYNYSKP